MRNVVIGALIAAVLMFVWGFIYWTLLPTSSSIFKAAPDTLAAELRSLPESGTYAVPDPQLMKNDSDEFSRRHEAGPVATVFVYTEGRAAGSPTVFFVGFIGMFIACLLMASVLRMAAPALGGFGARFGFVFLAGLIGVGLSDLGNPIWWLHPWALYVNNAIFHATSWLIVGVVLARMVRSERARV